MGLSEFSPCCLDFEPATAHARTVEHEKKNYLRQRSAAKIGFLDERVRHGNTAEGLRPHQWED